MRKLYLSAILDLCNRRIVSVAIREANDSALVHEALDQAIAANPGAHPLFHSGKGISVHDPGVPRQAYLSRDEPKYVTGGQVHWQRADEGFWGTLKRERYYSRSFTSRVQLDQMIREYIAYYNSSRLQRRIGVHTPMEVYAQCRIA